MKKEGGDLIVDLTNNADHKASHFKLTMITSEGRMDATVTRVHNTNVLE